MAAGEEGGGECEGQGGREPQRDGQVAVREVELAQQRSVWPGDVLGEVDARGPGEPVAVANVESDRGAGTAEGHAARLNLHFECVIGEHLGPDFVDAPVTPHPNQGEGQEQQGECKGGGEVTGTVHFDADSGNGAIGAVFAGANGGPEVGRTGQLEKSSTVWGGLMRCAARIPRELPRERSSRGQIVRGRNRRRVRRPCPVVATYLQTWCNFVQAIGYAA